MPRRDQRIEMGLKALARLIADQLLEESDVTDVTITPEPNPEGSPSPKTDIEPESDSPDRPR